MGGAGHKYSWIGAAHMSLTSTSSSASIFWRSVQFGFFAPKFSLTENYTSYNSLICGRGVLPCIKIQNCRKILQIADTYYW